MLSNNSWLNNFFLPARWCSGWSVRFPVGRLWVHSLNRVIPKTLKNGIHSFPAWHEKGIVRRSSRQSCLCRWARHSIGRLHLYVADRWPTRNSPDYNCELLTQHVIKSDSWVPTSGSPPSWWWDYQSLMIGSKWAAIFPLA